MRHKACVVLVLCLAALTMLTIAVSPAAAATDGLPQVGTPNVARVLLYDGEWWTGRWISGGTTWYPPGTPIPASDYVMLCGAPFDEDKSLVEELPQFLFYSLTVKDADNKVVVKTSEEQSPQFYGPVTWNPSEGYYYRLWEMPLGQLPPGTYDITFVDRLVTTVVGWYRDENGDWVSVVYKPSKGILRTSFTVH